MNNKFESWQELFQWIADGRDYVFNHKTYTPTCFDYYSINGETKYFHKFSKHINPPKPKEIVLYNYIYGNRGGTIRETGFTNTPWKEVSFNECRELLKTETKTVKLGE